MMIDGKILDAATAWAVRTQEPDFDDWPAFGAWLEQSPEHAAAYDYVLAAAESGAEVLTASPANDVEPITKAQPRRWLFPAFAASLACVAALWLWIGQGGAEVYSTAPGEIRSVILADGSTVVLSGDTRLVTDSDRPRQARLEQGRALFEIDHDDSAPFSVRVSGATLVDAGTIFDVAIRARHVSVGVSEGAVIYNPQKQNARIEPGQVLSFDKSGRGYNYSTVPVAQIGEWREGRLTFQNAPLADIALEVSRATGIDYEVDSESGNLQISGSVMVDPLRRDPASLGPLLGIEARPQGSAWILKAE